MFQYKYNTEGFYKRTKHICTDTGHVTVHELIATYSSIVDSRLFYFG